MRKREVGAKPTLSSHVRIDRSASRIYPPNAEIIRLPHRSCRTPLSANPRSRGDLSCLIDAPAAVSISCRALSGAASQGGFSVPDLRRS